MLIPCVLSDHKRIKAEFNMRNYKNIWGLNDTFWSNSVPSKTFKGKFKILRHQQNENLLELPFWDTAKAVLRGKLTVLILEMRAEEDQVKKSWGERDRRVKGNGSWEAISKKCQRPRMGKGPGSLWGWL